MSGKLLDTNKEVDTMFEKIKKWHIMGLWTDDMVKAADEVAEILE